MNSMVIMSIPHLSGSTFQNSLIVHLVGHTGLGRDIWTIPFHNLTMTFKVSHMSPNEIIHAGDG